MKADARIWTGDSRKLVKKGSLGIECEGRCQDLLRAGCGVGAKRSEARSWRDGVAFNRNARCAFVWEFL